MVTVTAVVDRLREELGPQSVLTDAASCRVYAHDASHFALGLPAAVLLPNTAAEVQRVLALCTQAGVKVVCRGTGTGLSGGALPGDGSVVLSTSRLREMGPVDEAGRRIQVGSGVLNEEVSRRARRVGLEFAPDPSSQAASTIGGNIAENAGGPHCLRYGVTLSHLRRLSWCDAEGRAWTTGRGLTVERGVDLVSLLCGSEGTLGVITQADLALIPAPGAVRTLLAVFPRLDDAVTAVVTLVQSGLLPVAVEIIDQTMLRAVEAAFAFDFPTDVEAAMIVEFTGPEAGVSAEATTAADLLKTAGAREVTLAVAAEQRASLWRCRKKAFGAVGRLASSYVTMDVVVPLDRLPQLVKDIQQIKQMHGVEIATAFHAGDGNLHPGIHYDDRDRDQTRRAHAAADAIITRALELDGSCTGEHGVGIEKLHMLPKMLDAVTASLQAAIKEVFDPAGLLNPGKLLTPPDADYAAVKTLPDGLRINRQGLTVTAPGALALAEVQAAVQEHGLWVPVGAWVPSGAGVRGLGRGGTVGDLIMDLVPGPAFGAWGTARDVILELWATTGDGRDFHVGAPVFKNVAGYSLAQALCGSGDLLARPQAATLALRPLPPSLGFWVFRHPRGSVPRRTLAPVLKVLTEHQGPFPGPVVIVEADGDILQGPLVVLAAGRNAAWDLPAVGARLIAAAGDQGFRPDYQDVRDFAQGLASLSQEGVLPAWSTAAETWTLLAPRPGATEAQISAMPGRARRILCQLSPRLCWSPEALQSDDLWHADIIWKDGVRTPLPAPDPRVPLSVLRGLKLLFDSQGVLSRPGWLEP